MLMHEKNMYDPYSGLQILLHGVISLSDRDVSISHLCLYHVVMACTFCIYLNMVIAPKQNLIYIST